MFEKFKAMRTKKLERQSIFLALAALMCLVVVGFTVYVITSMGSDLNEALNVPQTSPSPVKFDIKGFEDLKLVR